MRERLLWELRCRRDQFSIDAGIEKGRPLPQWYLDCPELLPGEEFFLRAFWDLSTMRPLSERFVGRIPWDRAMDYGCRQGLEDDTLDLFWSVITAMDNGYADWMRNEHDRFVRNRPPPQAKPGERTRTRKGPR